MKGPGRGLRAASGTDGLSDISEQWRRELVLGIWHTGCVSGGKKVRIVIWESYTRDKWCKIKRQKNMYYLAMKLILIKS